MRNKILPLIIFTMSVLMLVPAVKAELKPKADSLAKIAVECINKGKLGEAIYYLDSALTIEPQSFELNYEKALAHYRKKQYDTTLKLLETLRNRDEANDNLYQLLGNAYSMIHKDDTAKDVYMEGIQKFPNSGRLYFELGVTQFTQDEKKKAMYSWEKGVMLDPFFANNYFQLQNYYKAMNDYAWSLLYGEIFINISDNKQRSDFISKSLWDTYCDALYFRNVSDSSVKIYMSKVSVQTRDIEKFEGLLPEQAIEHVYKKATKDILPDNRIAITIADLIKIRQNFISIWYNDGWDKKFKIPLYDFHKQMITDKIFEAYNYWVFRKGSEREFADYYAKNKDSFNKLGLWMQRNRFSISKDNYIHRNF